MKAVVKIFHSLILLVIGAALIGVNVSRLYCACKQEVYLQVKLMPEEDSCHCKGKCGCCKKTKACHKKICHKNAPSGTQGHAYYKVKDYSEAERGIDVQIAFSYLDGYNSLDICFPVSDHQTDFSFREAYADWPPSQEQLCVYRC